MNIGKKTGIIIGNELLTSDVVVKAKKKTLMIYDKKTNEGVELNKMYTIELIKVLLDTLEGEYYE